MLEIKDLHIQGYKKVIEAQDPEIGLHCFIAIHNSSLGPALGGTRIYPYSTPKDALNDVLRLAKTMTYKSAIAESGTGGGKSVIIANPQKDKSERLLRAFGEVVHYLKGEYIAAEDLGSDLEDMLQINKETPYVSALPLASSSGDPSRFTAWGVVRGMQAVATKLWGNPSLKGKKILIQGLGNVGSKLANFLFWEGADLILTDIDPKKLNEQCLLYRAQAVDRANFFETNCDILSPCAMGGIITAEIIPKLNCKAIAGAANNQLLEEALGLDLMNRRILYAPDYIINSGGLINAASEFNPGGYDPRVSRDKINHIYDILLNIFDKAEKEHRPTTKIGEEIAEYNIKNKIGMRKDSIHFKR